MGNWRTVHITGTCEKPQEVRDLIKLLDEDIYDESTEDWKLNPRWTCLHSGGAAGLPNWGGHSIHAIGNLGERDYSPDDVAKALDFIADVVAPSLDVRVDCGGDYETLVCHASVFKRPGEPAFVGKPHVQTIPAIPDHQVRDNLLRQLRGKGIL